MRDPLEDAGAEVSGQQASRIFLLFLAAMVALLLFVPGSRTPIALIVGIILMVMLHEFGHYWTAKRAGMKVTEFFVGFGPRLWSFRRGETEYGVKALPLGGYVRIIGMSNLEEVDPDDEPRTFRAGRTRDRLVVILAGVTVNLIIAFVIFFAVIAGQGRVVEGPSTTVNSVVTGSAAAAAGIQPGDKFLAVDGHTIDGWDQLKSAIERNGGKSVTFTVRRDGVEQQVTATLQSQSGQGFLGVGPTSVEKSVGVLAAVPQTFTTMKEVSVAMFDGLKARLSPSGVSTSASQSFTSAAPKAGSAQDLNRPQSLIGIVNNGSQLIGGDVWGILWLLATISFVLALFNLLPILPLDGGHAVVVVYEWVASKVQHHRVRVDYRKLIPISVVLLLPLLFLSLSAMVLDIRQLGQ